eukprot:gene2364-4701_t
MTPAKPMPKESLGAELLRALADDSEVRLLEERKAVDELMKDEAWSTPTRKQIAISWQLHQCFACVCRRYGRSDALGEGAMRQKKIPHPILS